MAHKDLRLAGSAGRPSEPSAEKDLHAQMAAAERSATQQHLIALLGPASHEYLERLADTDRSLSRQVRELLALVREYGPEAVSAALAKAHAARAFGADYTSMACQLDLALGFF